MLVSRLSRRVLAEHHLALSDQVRGRCLRKPHDDHEGHVGVISTSLHVQTCVDKCTRWLRSSWTNLGMGEDVDSRAWPEVIVDGHADARLSYIREHIEYVPSMLHMNWLLTDLLRYIVFELLKNVRVWDISTLTAH